VVPVVRRFRKSSLLNVNVSQTISSSVPAFVRASICKMNRSRIPKSKEKQNKYFEEIY
jgi:hypothetical protein